MYIKLLEISDFLHCEEETNNLKECCSVISVINDYIIITYSILEIMYSIVH